MTIELQTLLWPTIYYFARFKAFLLWQCKLTTKYNIQVQVFPQWKERGQIENHIQMAISQRS